MVFVVACSSADAPRVEVEEVSEAPPAPPVDGGAPVEIVDSEPPPATVIPMEAAAREPEPIASVLARATRIVEPSLLALHATKWATFDKRPIRIALEFCIDASGVPEGIAVVNGPTWDGAPARILRRAVNRWRFGAAAAGTCTRVDYRLRSSNEVIVLEGPTGRRRRRFSSKESPPGQLIRAEDISLLPSAPDS